VSASRRPPVHRRYAAHRGHFTTACSIGSCVSTRHSKSILPTTTRGAATRRSRRSSPRTRACRNATASPSSR
jgi:hypothetical protein